MLTQLSLGVLLGLLGLLLAPPLSKPTRFATWIGNTCGSVAMQSLDRPAISWSTTATPTLRKRAFDSEANHEYIVIDGDRKPLRSVRETTLRWGKRPFTFVDERIGVTFDLRDVAFGRAYVEHKRDSDFSFAAYQTERDEDGGDRVVGVNTYVRAFVEAASGPYPMDLAASVRPMVDGGEDAGAYDRVWEGTKRMFLPYQKSTGILKLALPLIAFGAALFGGYYLFGPGRLPGSPVRTVGVGAGAVLPWAISGADGPGRRQRLAAWLRDWWAVLLAGGVVVAVVAVGLRFAPAATVAVLGGALAVIVGVPLGSAVVISAAPASIAEPVAEGWAILAFTAFADPVVEQLNDRGMRIREGEDSGPRYRFCKTYVGFDLDASPEAFGRAGETGKALEGSQYRGDARADGGEGIIPEDCVPTHKVTSGGHRGLIPTFDAADKRDRARRQSTFVRTDRWLARFAGVATGERVKHAQQAATKEFADGSPDFSDRQIMLLSLGAALAGIGISVGVWGVLL
jgi:hypothetical protein